MSVLRKNTKRIKVGDRFIGGGEKILIQSMTCTPTQRFEETLAQILELEGAGCDIVRFTVPDREAARNIERLKANTHIPLVADIHYDYRLAILAAEAGIDKIRINPGNIGDVENVKKVAKICREKGIPIRIGVNAGSLDPDLYDKYHGVCPEALCESALNEIKVLEACDFDQIVVSVKSSDVSMMIETNRLLSKRTNYPIHLGVTEAGTVSAGIIKSAIGIGSLLADGIGDTLRVSLTTRDLTEEVRAAKNILHALDLSDHHINIVSCPTCGRTKIDLVGIAEELEKRLSRLDLKPHRNIKVAVMGCVVNGPGEAHDADIGIAGGKEDAILFRKGKMIHKIPEDSVLDTLIEGIKTIVEESNE